MKPRYVLALFAALFLCLSAQSQQIDLAGGYNFQNSEQGNNVRTNLNGRYVSGQYDLNDHFALTLEADNYYGAISGEKERNRILYSARNTPFSKKKPGHAPSSISRGAISIPLLATTWNMPSIFNLEEDFRSN